MLGDEDESDVGFEQTAELLMMGTDNGGISINTKNIGQSSNVIETGNAAKLSKMKELLNLDWTNNSNQRGTATNDTIIYNVGSDNALGGGDGDIIVILEDFTTELTFDMFDLL